MTKLSNAASFRGIAAVRADTSDPKTLIAELNKAVAALRTSHDEQLKDIKKGFDDVVKAEQVDRINKTVSDLQAAVDATSAKLAAVEMNGGKGNRIVDAEYTSAFSGYMKKGDVQASLNKGTAAEGGYVTPVEWDRTINDELKIISSVRQLMNVKTVGVHAASKLVNKHGLASGWVGETAARPETAGPQLATLPIAWGEIYANPSATQQILDDAEINLEAWLAAETELEFSYQEGAAVISGNGTNKPNGILTYVTGGANAAAHPSGAILATNSGHATQVTADALITLIHALPSAFTPRASFAMNRGTLGAIRLLKDTTGNYLWQPSYAGGQPSTLAGYPVVEVPDMPAIAASAKPVLFGDFKRAYTIYDRAGIRVLRDPYTNKPYVMFYTTKRVGGVLDDPLAVKALNISV
jgi:HK97 family phage major capsid protein